MWIPDWCKKVHQVIPQIGYFHIDAGSVPNWVFLQLFTGFQFVTVVVLLAVARFLDIV